MIFQGRFLSPGAEDDGKAIEGNCIGLEKAQAQLNVRFRVETTMSRTVSQTSGACVGTNTSPLQCRHMRSMILHVDWLQCLLTPSPVSSFGSFKKNTSFALCQSTHQKLKGHQSQRAKTVWHGKGTGNGKWFACLGAPKAPRDVRDWRCRRFL